MFFVIPFPRSLAQGIISAITFPGAILRAALEKLCCDLTDTPVYGVEYVQLDKSLSAVAHPTPRDLRGAFVVTAGPFLGASMLAAALAFPAVLFLRADFDSHAWSVLLLWLAISAATNALPGDEDAEAFSARIAIANTDGFLQTISGFFSGLMGIGKAISIIYGVARAVIPAYILTSILT
jgi:hypothetical protein